MINDFSELPDGRLIECDLCVVGAGVAGITVATSLAASSLHVVLLEGGGFEIDVDSQNLYEGQNVGIDYHPLSTTRLRYFGGTSNHWSGACLIYDPIDFETRPWIPLSGWPVDYADYAAYLPMAAQLLDLTKPYDPTKYWEAFGIDLPAFDPAKLYFTTSQQRMPPVRFGDRFGADLQTAPRIRVLLNANVIDIVTNGNANHVESVTVRSFRGSTSHVKARKFVIACGGIENARLLLASRSVERHGLGNRHDLVGRYFTDHPGLPIGEILTEDQGALLDPIRSNYVTKGDVSTRWGTLITLSPELQERYGIPNSVAFIQTETQVIEGVDAAARLARALKDGRWPADGGTLVGQAAANLDDVALAAWQRFVLGRRNVSHIRFFQLNVSLDPVPNPSSRVLLDSEVDPFGMPRVELDLRVSEPESRGIKVLGEVIGAELARLGLGRVRLYDWVEAIGDGLWYDAYAGFETEQRFANSEVPFGHHHHGTTRMASDPHQGVVDADCKVHGIDNLYMAGSSTFPTASGSNPTMSIVAFALRLADHLRDS